MFQGVCKTMAKAVIGVVLFATGAPAQEDPFSRFEEINGAVTPDWARTQNVRSLAELKGDASYLAGDPDIPVERAYIEKFSPCQNLKKDVEYPRPFFFTSAKVDHVHPGHAYKMAGKMEAYGHPVLYYRNIEGGHSAAANRNQAAYRAALQYVYFARQLMDVAQE